jgi:CubicO group peptidase (beta-lactamase class C family)
MKHARRAFWKVSCSVLSMILLVLLLSCAARTSEKGPSPAAAASSDAQTGAASPAGTPEYWPTADWRTSTPEAQNMDSQKLAQMLEHTKGRNTGLHSLLVIRNGYIVSENYFESFRPEQTHVLYSCTKSFVSTLVGIAIDRGYISGVDVPVEDVFANQVFQNQDAQKREMTLENLLTMTSGLAWIENNQTYAGLSRSPDWVDFVMDKPMLDKPGTRFNYNSGCAHLLSAIVQLKTGRNTRAFAQDTLFKPLGISRYQWEVDSKGIPNGGWGLQMTPQDMAKLGYLFLHDGVWEGRQIVSKGWVKTATRTHVKVGGPAPVDYGYLWWTYPSLNAYAALGLDGQTIFVIPDRQMVIVTTARTPDHGHGEIFPLIEKYIVPAART